MGTETTAAATAVSRPRRSPADFEAALEALLLEQGYAGLTIGAMAAALRCSRRRLYEIAETKEGIFLVVADRFFARLRTAGWTAAGAETDYGAKIRRYLGVGAQMAGRASHRFLTDIDALPEGRRLFDAHQRERIDGLRGIVEDGIARGVIRDVPAKLVAEIMYAAVRRLREPATQRAIGLSFEDCLRQLSDILQAGIAARA